MITGEHPFDKSTSTDRNKFLLDLMKNQKKLTQNNLEFPKDCRLSEDIKDLIRKMLIVDSDKRITLKKIKEHEAIKKYENIKSNQSMIGKSQLCFKSILTVSQFMDKDLMKSNVQTGAIQNKRWMNQIEKVIENEVKRIEWLDNLNNFVCDYFDMIDQLNETNPNHKNLNR